MLSSVHSWIYPDIQPVPERTTDGIFRRMISVDNTIIPVAITQKGKSLHAKYPDIDVNQNAVSKKIQQILGLSVDTSHAINTIKMMPELDSISESLKTILPYSTDTVFEGLIKSILQQQISYRAANVITKRLVEQLTESTFIETNEVNRFPNPEEIFHAGVDTLNALGLGYKTERIIHIVKMISKRELELEELFNLPYDELNSMLSPIPGVGEWTIQALSIASLQDFSVFPFGDLAIQNVLGSLFKKGKRLTKAEVESFSDECGTSGPMVLYLIMSAYVLGWINQN